jgi:hypothetical protein
MTSITGSCADSLNLKRFICIYESNFLTKNSSRMKYLARVTSESSPGSALSKIKIIIE